MPDVLGAVSSLTRDDATFDVKQRGSGSGGIERARLMGHVRVRYAVFFDGEGKCEWVGLARVGRGIVELRKDRLYV